MDEKIAIMTDTNSGIMAHEAECLGIFVVPMPFVVNGEERFEGVNLDADSFYEQQRGGADIVTSQPSPVALGRQWQDLLETYDSVIYIPMSSSLSGSYETACNLSRYFDGRVHVVDNQRISVTQRAATFDAIHWVNEGLSAQEVCDRLNETKLEASIYLIVDTMAYLHKSGRITPAAAAIGSMLKIKPVLQIQGGKLDAFMITKTMKAARGAVIKALSHDIEERFCGRENVNLYIAYSDRKSDAVLLASEISSALGVENVMIDKLSLSVACHVGPGSLGVGCVKKQY